MEKVIYALRDADEGNLKERLPDALSFLGCKNLRINLQDADVVPGAGLIQKCGDQLPNAVAQCWMPSANPIFRKAVDQTIAETCTSFDAWLVAESTIIENVDHSPARAERTAGFSQMAFLTLPEKLDWAAWRAVWRDYHTQVAIDTQSNFEYVQNLVVEPLTDGAPPFIAIVEECFPIEALTDPLVFFDAVGDQGKFEKNLEIMMESCGRFIEPGTIDVFPSSQYNFD